MKVIQQSGIKSSAISAVIIRADGTREELGVISYWHVNPFKRLWFRFKQFIK
jgi:hypothetical protein